MANRKPFFTDNMTLNQIINLGHEILSKLNMRDLSRVLRTVALAANKHLNRQKQYTYKRNGKYVEKKGSPGLDALYQTGKNRNQIYEEFSRARDFLNSESSTIKGAKELRKKKERV